MRLVLLCFTFGTGIESGACPGGDWNGICPGELPRCTWRAAGGGTSPFCLGSNENKEDERAEEVRGVLGGFNFGMEKDLSRSLSSNLESGRETTRASSEDTSLGMDTVTSLGMDTVTSLGMDTVTSVAPITW